MGDHGDDVRAALAGRQICISRVQSLLGRVEETWSVASRPRWVICPMGEADNVSAFMGLFGANGLDHAVLLAFAQGDKKQVEDVRKPNLLKAGRILQPTILRV